MNVRIRVIVTLLLVLNFCISIVIAEEEFFDEYDQEFRERLDDDRFEREFRDGDEKFKERFKDDEYRAEFKDEKREEEFREPYEERDYKEYDKRYDDEFKNENFLFEKIFHILGDELDERELIGLCPDAEKIADFILEKTDSMIGDLSKVCNEIEEEVLYCKDQAKQQCNYFGPDGDEHFDEIDKLEKRAYGCPPNHDAYVELCILRTKEQLEFDKEFNEQECEFEWEDYGKENQEYCEEDLKNAICDEDTFMDDCLERWGAFDCPHVPEPFCYNGYPDQNYDDRGCIIEWKCIEHENECEKLPEDYEKPPCEDGYYEPKYDSAGCTIDYFCVHEEIPKNFDACPEIYEPVCGSNGVTYGNDCFAKQEGVHDFIYGECSHCPFSDEEVEKMFDECIESDGAPEKIYDDQCIIEVKCTITERDDSNLITGQVVLDTHNDFVEQCSREWHDHERFCKDLPKDCSKQGFIEGCIDRRNNHLEKDVDRSKKRCELEAKKELRHLERECSRFDTDKEHCFSEAEERCTAIKNHADACRTKLTRENFREYIVQEAARECSGGKDHLRDEVYSNNKARDVIEKIKELRESGVSEKFTDILDEETQELDEFSNELEELAAEEEKKGTFYKVKLFLGFAKKIEEGEIDRLELSKQRLETSVTALNALADSLEDKTAAEILRLQSAELEKQKQDIDTLIEQKQKKSKGLLQLFGLLG